MSIKSKARTYFRSLRRMKIGLSFAEAARLAKCFAQGKNNTQIEETCKNFVETNLFGPLTNPSEDLDKVFVLGTKDSLNIITTDLEYIRKRLQA